MIAYKHNISEEKNYTLPYSPDIIHVISIPRPSTFLATLSCIIVYCVLKMMYIKTKLSNIRLCD